MNYSEVLEQARTCIGKYCKACPECNGKSLYSGICAEGRKAINRTPLGNN